jgi:hypothetical protein
MIDERTGIQRITDERARQIAKEGWTPGHDDEHDRCELALVGALYASPIQLFRLTRWNGKDVWVDPWPVQWAMEWDKRDPNGATGEARIRELEKAGALIAAEIDRLMRLILRGTP